MTYLNGVLQTILPVILVIAIGAFCRRRSLISREGITSLKYIAVNIALPAVLLNAFATTQYSMRNILVPLLMFGICIAAFGIGVLVRKGMKSDDRFLPYLTTGFEAGMLGYTLFAMLYGEDQIASFAIVDLGQVLFVFTVYKILLNMEFSESPDSTGIVKSMVTSPIIIAIAAGVLIGTTGLYDIMESAGISPVFDRAVSFVSAPTSVLILLALGYDLVLDHIPWKKVLISVSIRLGIMLVFMAAVTALISRLFAGDPMLCHAVWVIFILPPPFVLPVFADDESQYTYISSVLTVYTLLSIICFAVLAVLE